MTAPVPCAPDLSELVSARLCHDLISPMGAIGNGLELMQLSGASEHATELALINESLANALAKVRFYRVAFGPADPLARLSVDEAAQLTDAMFHGRFSVHWQRQSGDLPRTLVRILYLAVLCLEKSLPMGGQAVIRVGPGGVAITVDDRRVAAPAELWAHLTDGRPLAELKPDGVQFALLRQALAHAGHRLQADIGPSSVALKLETMLAEARI